MLKVSQTNKTSPIPHNCMVTKNVFPRTHIGRLTFSQIIEMGLFIR